MSRAIIDEYFEVLRRPKFQIESEEFDDFASLLIIKADFVTPLKPITVIVSDPSDNKFLEAALEGKADFIVSGDAHLLGLEAFQGIPILTARKFLEQL